MIAAASTLTRTFGIIAPTLTILQCLAQGNRIRTTGAKGVSLDTWILSTFLGEIWFCYGLIFHVTAELVANVPAFIVSFAVMFLAAKSQEKMRRAVVGLLVFTVVTVLATFAGSFHDLRWVLATISVGSSIFIYLPQLALVIRPEGPERRVAHQLVPRVPHVTRMARLRIPYPPATTRHTEFRHAPVGVHHLRSSVETPHQEQSPDRSSGADRRVTTTFSCVGCGSAARTVSIRAESDTAFSRASAEPHSWSQLANIR